MRYWVWEPFFDRVAEMEFYVYNNSVAVGKKNMEMMERSVIYSAVVYIVYLLFVYVSMPGFETPRPFLVFPVVLLVSGVINRYYMIPRYTDMGTIRIWLLIYYSLFFGVLSAMDLSLHDGTPSVIIPVAIVAFATFYTDYFYAVCLIELYLLVEYGVISAILLDGIPAWTQILNGLTSCVLSLMCSWVHLGVQTDNSNKDRVLIDQGSRDMLTGLLNKLSFESAVADSLKEKEEGTISALFILDFDNFKYVNDNYGHQVGDDVLKAFGRILVRAFRAKDIVGRVGGDEFMAFMPNMSANGIKRAEGISEDILHELYILDVGAAKSFSCSIGIATDSGTCDFKELYGIADEALYEAKERGKACYVRHSSE